MTVPAQGVQQYINHAMALMHSEQYSSALKIFLALEKAGLEDPRLYRSIGSAYERLHKKEQACHYFEKSLKLAPEQQDLIISLARLYHQQKKWEPAERYYRKGVKQGSDPNALLRFGHFLLQSPTGSLEESEALFKEIRLAQPSLTPQALAGLAKVENKRGMSSKATTLLREAHALAPQDRVILRELAWQFKDSGEFSPSLPLFEKLVCLKDAVDEDYEDLALAYLDNNQPGDASKSLRIALVKFPASRRLHKLYSRLSHELGSGDCLRNYHQLSANTMDEGLLQDYFDLLVKRKEYDVAQQVLRKMEARFPNSARFLYLQAVLTYNKKEYSACIGNLEKLTSGMRGQGPVHIAELRALAFLAVGDAKGACADLDWLLSIAPQDQYYWALKSTQWRLEQNEKYHWLCDYEALVQSAEIACPPGYKSISEFNDALCVVLSQLHSTQRSPLEQSLSQGTQTPGNLLVRKEPIIQALGESLHVAAESMLSGLPRDDTHPALRSADRNFTFAASWSVRLANRGFHFAHVHPKGWYSSAYYVALPEGISGESREGWLHLGNPGINGCEHLPAQRWVEPRAGKLVLFPSFMWHGTAPFNNGSERITVAFDLS